MTIDIISLIAYSAAVLIEENKKLTNHIFFIERTFNKASDLALEFAKQAKPFAEFQESYLSLAKEFSKEELEILRKNKKKEFSANWVYLFSILSIIGFLLMILGIFWTNSFLSSAR